MTHFGILCPATSGHLNPMTTLGWELQRRGHQVTVVGILDAQSSAHSAGLGFTVIGESNFPLGAMSRIFDHQGKLSGLSAIRYTVTWMKDIVATFLREAPAAIQEAGVEALLVDQISPEGGTIADFLKIPFVSVANSLLIYRGDNSIPPSHTLWNYSPTRWARLGNLFGYKLLDWIVQPVVNVIVEYRRELQLSPYIQANDFYSKLALISQQAAAFEFPRQNLPEYVHFTGSWRNPNRQSVDFPFEQLTGQPLIYASLGTLQNRLQHVFQDIAQACVGLDAQLIISLGNGIPAESMPKLPGSVIVVQYAPQLELLQKANLVITHAGLNTTLDSLSQGVPMVAIPISLDQPGIAARIAWTGTGKVVPLSRLSVPTLRKTITEVLRQESYRTNVVRLQQALHNAGGVSRAVDIIEAVISTGNPIS